jgi:SRSO17 transposase
MSTTIVAPTCPLPPCNLTEQDVESLHPQLAAFVDLFAACFARADQRAWAHAYLQGLLSDLPRKSIEPIALAFGLSIRALQAFIGESPWRSTPLLVQQQAVMAQTLGEQDTV